MRTHRTIRAVRADRGTPAEWGLLAVVLVAGVSAAAAAIPGWGRGGALDAGPGVVGILAPTIAPPAGPTGAPRTDPASASLPGTGFSVRLGLPSGPVDPLAQVEVQAWVDGTPVGSLAYQWWDSLGDTGTRPTFTFTAPASGTVGVGVGIRDTLGDAGRANATLGVGSSPSIAIASSTPGTDVGLPIPVEIDVSGGVPGYRVAWQVLPGGALDSISMLAPGPIETSIVGTAPGFAWLRATVTDGEAMSTSVEAAVAAVHARPSLLVTAVARNVDAGAVAEVTGLVTGGTPPFSWTATASLPAVNVSGSTGLAGPSGAVAWEGEFVAPGNATVLLQLVDGAGQPTDANATVRVYPPLAASLLVETDAPAAGDPLNLSAFPTGGVPPYSYSLELSDGERAMGTLAASEPFFWIAHPALPGYLVVLLSLSDAVYGRRSEASTIAVGPAAPIASLPAPPPAAAATGTAPGGHPSGGSGGSGAATAEVLGGIGLVVVLAALGLAARRRFRRRSPATSGPDPRATDVVRRLLEESGGSTRSTLKLLAEEEGLSATEFDGALAKWEAEGRIRSEPDPDGGGLLVWQPTEANAEPAPPPTERP